MLFAIFCKLICSSPNFFFFPLKSLAVREFLCLDDPPGPFDSLEESRVSAILYITGKEEQIISTITTLFLELNSKYQNIVILNHGSFAQKAFNA